MAVSQRWSKQDLRTFWEGFRPLSKLQKHFSIVCLHFTRTCKLVVKLMRVLLCRAASATSSEWLWTKCSQLNYSEMLHATFLLKQRGFATRISLDFGEMSAEPVIVNVYAKTWHFSVGEHTIFLHWHNLISKMVSALHSAVCSSLWYNGQTSWFKHWVGSFPVDSGATPVNLYLESWNLSDVWLCVCVCVCVGAVCAHVWRDKRILTGFGHCIFHFARISVICQEAEYVTRSKSLETSDRLF